MIFVITISIMGAPDWGGGNTADMYLASMEENNPRGLQSGISWIRRPMETRLDT